jgi:hypothetical protein
MASIRATAARDRAGGDRRCAEPDSCHQTRGLREPRPISSRRLDLIAEETERGWTGSVATMVASFRAHRARRQGGGRSIDGADRLGRRPQARRSCPRASRRSTAVPPALRRKDGRPEIPVRARCSTPCFAAGRKGLVAAALQGSGRDEPEQLWETTLDPNVRSLLQVQVNGPTRPTTLRPPDGRRGRAAPRLHPGKRARGGQSPSSRSASIGRSRASRARPMRTPHFRPSCRP